MIIKFEYDLYHIGDRLLEGVMVDVEVDEDTSKIVSIDFQEDYGRTYCEGLGAAGSADHWLKYASDWLGQNNNWEHWCDE